MVGFPADCWGADVLTLTKGEPIERATAMLLRTAVLPEAMLLHTNAKRTKKADTAAADIIGAISASALGRK